MKITINLEFSDEERRALAFWYGERGLVSADRLRAWVGGALRADFDHVLEEYRRNRRLPAALRGEEGGS